jgi:hypothetical protein
MASSLTDDRVEITDLLHRYAWAIDGRCSARLADVFTPDVHADYGTLGAFDGIDAVIEAFDVMHSQFASTQHAMSNACIDVDGDRASCRSYFVATMTSDPASAGQREGMIDGRSFRSGGFYEDELVRTGAGWRISRRICIGSWYTEEPGLVVPMPEELEAARAASSASGV